MRRSTVGIILVLALGCLVAPHTAEAQQSVKVHRIGVLWTGFAATGAFVLETLRQGLRELGLRGGTELHAGGPLGRGETGAPGRPGG